VLVPPVVPSVNINSRQRHEFIAGALQRFIYPEPIFGGGIRLLLYTLIPAAFSGFLPARLVRNPSWAAAASAISGAACLVALALVIFARGRRRYESGNQVAVR
jgi:ABC-2 type transport system permease protein